MSSRNPIFYSEQKRPAGYVTCIGIRGISLDGLHYLPIGLVKTSCHRELIGWGVYLDGRPLRRLTIELDGYNAKSHQNLHDIVRLSFSNQKCFAGGFP